MRFILGLALGIILAVLVMRERAPGPVDAYIGITRTAPKIEATLPEPEVRLSVKQKRTLRVRDAGLKSSDQRAAAIDRFFAERNAPLAGYGSVFMRAADAYGLDWRMLPAIAWKESLGGKSRVARVYKNPFGVGDPNFWKFADFEHAIYRTARMVGGDSRYYREDMRPGQILRVFNTVEQPYPHRVMRIMTEVHKS